MTIRAADLFCGAGGATEGVYRAARARGASLEMIAINHWPVAIETHQANHPEATHLCMSVDAVDPRAVVPSGHLHLLIAGVECTHHSNARGGRPINDQSRASAWNVLRWCELLRVDHVLIENVPEFQSWGPLDAKQRPIKSRKGETYRAFLAALESLGYTVEARVLNAADYGDATTRRRLFIQARRGRKPIVWPEPTHSRRGETTLLRRTQPWRPAREVIDWSIPSQSIRDRKRPLSPNTLRRIEAGLRRFGGRPFVLQQQSGGVPRLTDDPMPTIAAKGAIALAEPFIVTTGGPTGQGRRPKSVDEPLPTILGENRFALVEPFVTSYYGNGENVRPVSEPLATVTTRDRFALVIPDGVDVRFRMLQPHELAAAMGFPRDYVFKGTKTDVVRQIGNAWPCHTAAAICTVILREVIGKQREARTA